MYITKAIDCDIKGYARLQPRVPDRKLPCGDEDGGECEEREEEDLEAVDGGRVCVFSWRGGAVRVRYDV